MNEKIKRKVLCLGNNTEDTDQKSRALSSAFGLTCYGLLSDLDGTVTADRYQESGYYHSSIYDIEFGRLVEIANDFDEVIMLDQPKDQWSHPDAFYLTVKVLQTVSTKSTFLDPSYNAGVDYWQDLVDQNPSFCIFPFIELLVDRGNTTVCCRSTTPIVPIDQLEDFATDAEYQQIRTDMLAGVRVPKHCRYCYILEDRGIRSARQQETVEWANRLTLQSVDDLADITKPAYYEVRDSNKCNLQCRMCSPANSHLIDEEYRRIGLIDVFAPDNQKHGGGFEIVDFENLKKLYISGGEPLIMPATYDFFDRCIREGKTDFELLINTNGTKCSEKFRQQIRHFSNLNFIFSIDGYGDLNHYIRWPSDWNTIVENWRYFRDAGHKVTVNTTVSIYNVWALDQLYGFIDREFPGSLVHCQIAESPRKVHPLLFPDRALVVDSLQRITETQCYKNDLLFANNINGYIKLFQSDAPAPSTLAEFFQFNDLLDRSRDICLADYIPLLEQYRQKP